MSVIRSSPNRVSDTEAQRILTMIEDGRLKVGDRLPGQRELAAQLGIGRSSVREAIRYLEAVGVLETRPGIGTVVISDKLYAVVSTPLVSWLRENKAEVLKVFEVREVLETKAAELAALNISAEQVEQMQGIVEQMREEAEQENVGRLTELDLAFHDIVGRASGNELLCQILQSIQGALLESRRAVLALRGRAQRSLEEHGAIVRALMSADPSQARHAMQAHLRSAVGSVDDEAGS